MKTKDDERIKKFLGNLEERINFAKENGCKLLDCKVIDNNIELRRENIKLKKTCKKLAEKIEEIAYEMHLDEIYAELHNCEGIERNWTRGKEAEVKDILDWARNEVEKDDN